MFIIGINFEETMCNLLFHHRKQHNIVHILVLVRSGTSKLEKSLVPMSGNRPKIKLASASANAPIIFLCFIEWSNSAP